MICNAGNVENRRNETVRMFVPKVSNTTRISSHFESIQRTCRHALRRLDSLQDAIIYDLDLLDIRDGVRRGSDNQLDAIHYQLSEEMNSSDNNHDARCIKKPLNPGNNLEPKWLDDDNDDDDDDDDDRIAVELRLNMR